MAQRPSRRSQGPERTGAEPEELRSPLRLAASRGSLALELYEPVRVGPLEVTELALSLIGLKFPVDLSGGVPRFRQRRGELEHAALRLDLRELAEWLARRLRGAAPELGQRALAWPLPDGVGVGFVGERAALAFDLLWAPADGAAQLVVTNARGIGLGTPALGFALRVVDTLLGKIAVREGRRVSVPDAPVRIGRAVLPLLGARAPRARGVRFGGLSWSGEVAELELDSTFAPLALSVAASRALELCGLTRSADDALAQNALERARAEYLQALERAPRQPEVALSLAEIDLHRGVDAEAALSVVIETTPATQSGLVGAELLGRMGDVDSARATFEAALRAEVFAPLAALSFARLAELERELPDRLAALDLAVARAPAASGVRFTRLVARLAAHDLRGAASDAEHLEAAAQGSRARYDVCLKIGEQLLDHGLTRQAGKAFERALRYAPDDAAATAGLARVLARTGGATRAVALFERALRLSTPESDVEAGVVLELARLIADELSDLPQAIARVREIPAGAKAALEARHAEASWRARLGDIAGASLAYARLREALLPAGSERGDVPSAAKEWLLEAARFENDVTRDLAAAERHLAVLVRLAPRDARVAREYRTAAAKLAESRRQAERVETPIAINPELEPPELAGPDEAELEQQAARLESALRLDPENVEAALELIRVLEALGKDQDLLALVSARLEEAGSAERVVLVPIARRILARLVEQALEAGRADEAELYRVMHQRIASE